MLKCMECEKRFPVNAWLETITSIDGDPPLRATLRTPCCPFCHSINLDDAEEGGASPIASTPPKKATKKATKKEKTKV